MAASLPIAYPHAGASADRFLATEEERTRYALSQTILKEQAQSAGAKLAEYPEDLSRLGAVYIHEMASRAGSEHRDRSLHARVAIPADKLIGPFEGAILTQEEFDAANPVQGEGTEISLPFSSLRKDHEKGSDERDYVVKDSATSDYAGMRGRIDFRDQEKIRERKLKKSDKIKLKLQGWRMTHHTLTLGRGRYINPIVKMAKKDKRLQALEAGKSYLLGIGTIANTDDSPFGDGSKNNAELVGILKPAGAVLVSKRRIKKDEEIRTSYAVRRVFETHDDLRSALGLNKYNSRSILIDKTKQRKGLLRPPPRKEMPKRGCKREHPGLVPGV